ncbi:MAG: hypothetical protein KGS61_11210 [Verrucomicrobia bacterium]|nr:hypothetical protein [Verrucomicrobiota bacterium]
MNWPRADRQGPGRGHAFDAHAAEGEHERAPAGRLASVRFQLLSWLRLPPAQHVWILFICAIVGSFFVHEIGHCAVAWVRGLPAIPTPAKEYLLRPVPPAVQAQVALGGILGTVAVLAAAVGFVQSNPTTARSAALGGALTAPGFYTLRFLLAGRGHDATEFQEAQAALGLSYSGHAVDWLFVALFVVSAVFWCWRVGLRRLTRRLAGRLIGGALTALVVVVVLQSVNNALFDPLFER